jgi:aminocarboxymuconate-semialdehyde decarboxylase
MARGNSQWQVYVDTMGFDASNISFLVSLLGADRVLLGSDFPHQVDATDERVTTALTKAGVSEADQALIRGGNAASLLRRTTVPAS